MIDNDMTNILRNFSGVEEGTGEIVGADGERKVSNAATEKNAMKSLLEGLDAQQRSVKQMPGQHKMAKSTNTTHPAEKFLVGGEFEDETDLEEAIPTAGEWAPDGITAHRDAVRGKEDAYVSHNSGTIAPGVQVHVGHHVAGGSGIEGEVVKVEGGEVYIKNADGKTYKGQLKNTTVNEADTNEDTIAKRKTGSDVHKKQSFKDVFRSMDETEDDMASRFKKELHDEKSKRALSKGNNGKFNLAEEDEDLSWGDELIEDLKLLVQEAGEYDGIIDTQTIIDIIEKYEI